MLAMRKTTKASSGATRSSILVVEDHGPLRLSVVTWLRHRFPATHVRGVGSGEQAIDQIRLAIPDIVLMDVNLPGIDGFEAVRRMKVQAPGTAVVMLSAHDTPHHRLAAEHAGAADYVAKPDMEKQLEATVERLLRSRPGTRS